MSLKKKKVISRKNFDLNLNPIIPVEVATVLKYLVDLSSAPESGKDPF